MEWLPNDSDDVVKAAVMFDVSGSVPSYVVPSKNDTAPEGDAELVIDGLTVAVNVTLQPKVCGLALEDIN